ncbi:alpha/beta hydrolase [Actinobacteria bacterium YIM 96077]|uniref:Alpha/beta hydrolase n=1 Tax=Phytoactinopolyspora halophila TaxID=1981511 RepID=A0A329QBC6_9ACTN|nr:alpha/beta hydrolase [Phytoactinopolyspora halophila]AYY13034.1 alpha/beta hydrolase [Actinobacteria bacterium YIM 96077]RAW09705.1 alpha/beta hydrolase [Phytoactinopolyspora halophila]
MTELLDREAIVDGVRLAYRDRGSGEPVVFLHGTPSHSFIWREVVPEIERAGYRVVLFDLLGYGRSERPLTRDTSVRGQVDVLQALLQHLGIDRFSLVAHDIGGAIAQLLATAAPERVHRLMLIDTVSYDSWPSDTWQAIIRDHLQNYAAMPAREFEAMLTRQLRMTVANPDRMSGQVLEAYLAPHRSALGRASFFEHQVRHYDSSPTQQVVPALTRLTMPVRLLWGAQDTWQPLTYAKRLAADIPGSELVVIDNGGHFLMEDQPKRVRSEILGFL